MLNNAKRIAAVACFAVPLLSYAQVADGPASWDEEAAIQHSQAVIGGQLRDHVLTRVDGSEVRLSEYAGKPLLVSLIFTSCHHVCPTTTKRLDAAVSASRDVLGADSFNVVTIGFDAANDTPEAMRSFARAQSVDRKDWDFLSASRATIDELVKDLGFIYFPSPRGFDHITQVSVVDRDGTVYSQVYGVQFELPWLVEPLKDLVLNRPESKGRLFSGLVDRIRLFCTVYDPASDRYHFDFSLFIQMTIGAAAILVVAMFLFRGLRRPRAE
jgi:protein SCO1/2